MARPCFTTGRVGTCNARGNPGPAHVPLFLYSVLALSGSTPLERA